MAMWADDKFPCSMTLNNAEWQQIVEALKIAQKYDLASKVAALIGTRPE